MTSLELIDKKEQLKKRAADLISNAEKELRKLNEAEDKEFNKILLDIKETEDELRDIEQNNNKKESKKMEKFSLLKAINDVANNRQLDERSQEVVNEGIAEMRKAGQSFSGQIVLPIEERGDVIVAGTAQDGKETVATDKLGILEPLRNNLVMVQAGASYMNGLVGNVSIPVYSGSNVGWKGEIDAAANGKGTFSEVNLEPKRLTAFIDVSKRFLIQDSVSAEAMLKRDIVAAITEKLESTILGAEAGDTNKPEGMLHGVSADGAPVTYKDIVAMEEELESKNVRGNIKYIVSPSAKAALKTTEIAAGTAKMIMNDGEVNGYAVLSTPAVAGKGMIMGNFADYVIAQWGGIDLTVDPYTQAANGQVRIVINAYFDAKPRRAEAFVKKVLQA